MPSSLNTPISSVPHRLRTSTSSSSSAGCERGRRRQGQRREKKCGNDSDNRRWKKERGSGAEEEDNGADEEDGGSDSGCKQRCRRKRKEDSGQGHSLRRPVPRSLRPLTATLLPYQRRPAPPPPPLILALAHGVYLGSTFGFSSTLQPPAAAPASSTPVPSSLVSEMMRGTAIIGRLASSPTRRLILTAPQPHLQPLSFSSSPSPSVHHLLRTRLILLIHGLSCPHPNSSLLHAGDLS